MNILIIHEIDWINKVLFEPHHFAELLSKDNEVYVIDCPDVTNKNFKSALKTQTISNYSRIYKNSSITIIRPPTILIKGLNRFAHFFTCKKIIKQTIVEKEIDLILLYGAITNGSQTIKIAQEYNIPVVYRLLDVSHGLVKIPILKKLAKNYESYVLKNALKVLTTTNDLLRYAIEMGAKKNSVELFPLGINTEDFKPMTKNLDLAKSVGISDSDNVIVFIGTLYPFAGLKELISSFNEIEKSHPNTKLLIVGGGPSFLELEKQVDKMNLKSKVILTNFKPQNELGKYISLADICISPFQINYITERILPTKILEYFACAKPVLSTPLPGTVELLPDESYGILYSSSSDFTKTLIFLLMNKTKLQKLGQVAGEYAQKNHDWKNLSIKLMNLFESLVMKY